MKKLFVYGTLMGTMRPGTTYQCEATIYGAMYDLGNFPGVKTDAEGLVHGQLYNIEDHAWPALDKYEGVPHLYSRKTVKTVDDIECEVYHFNGYCREQLLIPEGRWTGRKGL